MNVSLGEPSFSLPLSEPAPGLPSKPPEVSSTSVTPFASLLRGVGTELVHGENDMRAAVMRIAHDDHVSSGELLILQSGLYRYSEAIDLVSRLVDRTSGAIKTLLQGSGQ